MEFEQLRKFYAENFFIGTISKDFSEMLALISLVCYLTFKLKQKNPDVTFWKVIYKIGKDTTDERTLKAIAIVCESLSYGATEFPNFGIEDKKIPKKIQDLIKNLLPF